MPGMMDQDSGTDDDLPPQHQHQSLPSSRVTRGGRTGSSNGRLPTQAAQTAFHHGRSNPAAFQAEQELKKLEFDAYTMVVRAFGAQSEAISWEKEQLMSDLRKELRVVDSEHRDVLHRVRCDANLKQIRESRASHLPAPASAITPHNDPAVARKKQKTGHGSQPSSALASLLVPKVPGSQSSLPSPTPGKRTVGLRGKKSKAGRHPAAAASKVSPGPSHGTGPTASNRAAGTAPDEACIGRRVKTRWPEDNKFYEGVITNYDPQEKKHALTYDMNTPEETWEWVNLHEVGPGNLKWVDAPPVPVAASKGAQLEAPSSDRGGTGRGVKRAASVVPSGLGRGRGARGPTLSGEKLATHDAPGRPGTGAADAAENGSDRKGSRQSEIPMEALKQEVDHAPDVIALETVKRQIQMYETQVRRQLEEMGDSSDGGESDDGGHAPSQSMGQDKEERPHKEHSQNNRGESDDEEDTAGDGRAESDGPAGDGGGRSDAEDDQHAEEADEADDG